MNINPQALAMALQAGTVMPKFQVEVLPEDHITERQVVKYTNVKQGDKSILEREVTTKEIKGGYMVYTSRGDALFIASRSELSRLGFDRAPNLVHEEGEELELGNGHDLKSLVAARTAFPRAKSAANH